MRGKLQSLSAIWNSYPLLYNNNKTFCISLEIQSFLTDLLKMGPFYASIIDMNSFTVQPIFNTANEIHGLSSAPTTYWDLIQLIHIEDIDHVLNAERAKLKFLKGLPEKQLEEYEFNYFFRMKVNGGAYHLFHHQAINITHDQQQKSTKSLIINTDINHLTTKNNYQLNIQKIHSGKSIATISLKQGNNNNRLIFSKRELEVLRQIALGFPSRIIAENLFISEATVRVHRKKIIKKSQTNNSNILIRKCLELGLI